VQAGPFYDPDDQRTQAIREPRDWEALDRAPDGWGLNAPLNVGQQARKRDKARMEERARQTNEDDPEDWFGSHRNARSRGMPPPKESRGRPPPKKPTFGPSFSSLARDGPSRDSSRYHDSRNGGGKDDRQSRDSGSSGLSIKGAHARTMDHQSSDSSYRDRDRYRDHSDHGRRDDSRRSDRSRHGHSRDYREDDRRDSRGSRGGDDRSLGGRDRDADFRPRYKGGYGR
jgi:protein AIR1/2